MQTLEVDPNSGKEACLVRFSTGKLNPEQLDKLEFKLHRKHEQKMEHPHQNQLVLTTNINEIPFCGRNFGSSNTFKTDTCDYYFGVRKHGSAKIKVVPAHLFQMNPQFGADNETETKEEALTYTEQRYNLIQQFGSGKTKKIVNKRIKEKLNQDMVSQTMESAVKRSLNDSQALNESQTLNDSLVQTPETGSLILPPHDKQATKLEDFYKLDELLPPIIREELDSAANEFVECSASDIVSWRKEKKFPEIILQTLDKLLTKETSTKLPKCQCLVYLHYLLSMHKMKSHELRTKYPLPQAWSNKVKDYLLEKFTLVFSGSKQRRTVPGRMKDLQVSYIIVLSLILNNYEIDLTSLTSDLKLSIKRMKIHAQAIGCKVSSQGEQFKASLTFPVKLLEPKERAAKRKLY